MVLHVVHHIKERALPTVRVCRSPLLPRASLHLLSKGIQVLAKAKRDVLALRRRCLQLLSDLGSSRRLRSQGRGSGSRSSTSSQSRTSKAHGPADEGATPCADTHGGPELPRLPAVTMVDCIPHASTGPDHAADDGSGDAPGAVAARVRVPVRAVEDVGVAVQGGGVWACPGKVDTN